jgi:uncharacterized protein (TIGR02271 family)
MADERFAPRHDDIEHGSRPEEVAAIPLVEERLVVRKRAVESGRVSVHVEVDEREEKISEQLCREDVQIERVPRNEQLTEAPRVRIEGSTTIIPIVEEVLVVEKRLVLVEEIHVSRRSTVETRETPVKLRSERATVRRDGGAETQVGSH